MEEALDLSFDRLLMMMMMIYKRLTNDHFYVLAGRKPKTSLEQIRARSRGSGFPENMGLATRLSWLHICLS